MPECRVPLTRVVHDHLREVLRPGDRAIDATAGNGHDTRFLAECVGPAGQVMAFDIQHSAIDATRARLEAAGLADRCLLAHSGHEHMADHVPADWVGNVAVVMFNLGYRPGGDKTVVTLPDTTIAALGQALGMLRADGVLSVMIYRGHAGGSDEATALQGWLARLPAHYIQRALASRGPVWHRIDKVRQPAFRPGNGSPTGLDRSG